MFVRGAPVNQNEEQIGVLAHLLLQITSATGKQKPSFSVL